MRRGAPHAPAWLAAFTTARSVVVAMLLWGQGCGPTLYVADMLEAEERLERAREANARFHAPYEYYAADAYLEKAREEASEGEYEDAVRFAKTASELGRRAVERSQSERRDASER